MPSDQLDIAPGAIEPKFRLSRVVGVVVVAAFAGGSLPAARGDLTQMSVTPLWQSWNLALLTGTLTLLNYTVCVTRWRRYLARLSHSIPLSFVVSTYIAGFAFALSPGKLGELLRARYYCAAGAPLRDVMAAFWVERLMDLLALFVLALLLFRAYPHHRSVIWVAGITIALGTAIVTLLPAERAARYVKGSPVIPRSLRQAIGHVLRSTGSARTLLCTWTVLCGSLIALVAWGLEGFGLGVLGSIFSPSHHDASLAVGVYSTVMLAGALSFLPGGVGSTEAVMTALLVNQGYTVSADPCMSAHDTNADALGTLRILETVRALDLEKRTRFYQASTSEMFGRVQAMPQRESTPFNSMSPYAAAKVYTYWITKNYRETYGLLSYNGILFNHESPKRRGTFVTRKITCGLARIHEGLESHPYLGDPDSLRDWGHARDYVRAQWLMLQQDKPDNFVIATSEQHSVHKFVGRAGAPLGKRLQWRGNGVNEEGVDTKTGRDVVKIDPRSCLPTEVETMLRDTTKARTQLGWQPDVSFDDVVKEMVASDLELAQ